MAGAASIKTTMTVTGLGDTVEVTNTKTVTVPVEQADGYTIIATAQATAVQLSDLAPQIALAKMYALYVKAVVGTIYIKVDTAGTTTFLAADAHLVLNVGEACILPLNPAGNAGVAFDAAAATDAMKWHLLGKA